MGDEWTKTYMTTTDQAAPLPQCGEAKFTVALQLYYIIPLTAIQRSIALDVTSVGVIDLLRLALHVLDGLAHSGFGSAKSTKTEALLVGGCGLSAFRNSCTAGCLSTQLALKC